MSPLRVGDPIADASFRFFGIVKHIQASRAIVQFWRDDDKPGPDGQRFGYFTASVGVLEYARDALCLHAEEHP